MPAHRLLTLMMSIIVWWYGAAHASAQTLTGRIVRQDDPTVAVAGARVSLAGDPAADPVFTDAQGRFALPATAVLPDALHIAKAGFLSQAISVATLTPPLEVALVRGAAISGVVRDAVGTPVPGVTVRVTPRDTTDGREARTTVTDDRGAYRIARLESGQYRVNTSTAVNGVAIGDTLVAASLAASDLVTVDVHAGDDLFVALTDETGRRVLDIDRGAIEGFVRNEAGEPAEGMIVRAFHGLLADGRRRLQQVGPDRMTDDRGRYRLYNLPPGQYLVQVEQGAPSSQGAPPASVPIYFPSAAAAADAVTVRVRPSLEVTDIDIAYRREQYSRVHGFVIATGNASSQGTITLIRAVKAGAIVEPPIASSIKADGSFLFERVLPGDYVLIMQRPTEPLPYRITVSSPDTGPLTVLTTPVRVASGRVVLEGDRSVTPQQFRLKLLPADPDVSAGVAASGLAEIVLIRADWTLSLQPLPVPSRFVLEKAPPGWFIKSVNVSVAQPAFVPIDVPASGNTEIVDVTLVLSKAAAALSGAIVGDSSQEPSGTRVVLFATDESRWYTQSPYVVSVTAEGGRFSLDSVAPGEYFVAAVPAGDIDVTAGELRDPDLLRQLSAEARRITLSEGARRTLELRVSRAAR